MKKPIFIKGMILLKIKFLLIFPSEYKVLINLSEKSGDFSYFFASEYINNSLFSSREKLLIISITRSKFSIIRSKFSFIIYKKSETPNVSPPKYPASIGEITCSFFNLINISVSIRKSSRAFFIQFSGSFFFISKSICLVTSYVVAFFKVFNSFFSSSERVSGLNLSF